MFPSLNPARWVSKIQAEYNFSVPADYAGGRSRSTQLVDLPVKVIYALRKDAEQVEVILMADNRAKDHWLRANFPTGIKTDITSADSHFDVVDRPIKLPDSTGWVEPATGTHPLRTFVSMSDQRDGFSLMTKGIFEYEAFEDAEHTLALTLIRACRIKLAVSEEKMTELPDEGVQCPGKQVFEYAICAHEGDWQNAGVINKAAQYYTPIRAAMTGNGKGKLEHEKTLLKIDNPNIHVTAVKRANNNPEIITRFFNPSEEKEEVKVSYGSTIKNMAHCNMNEMVIENMTANNNVLTVEATPKNIFTLQCILAK